MDYRRILTIMVGINVRSFGLREYPTTGGRRSILAQSVAVGVVRVTTVSVRMVVNIGLCVTLAV